MPESSKKNVRATGGCLCGAVRFEIRGEMDDVLNCHCEKCRRFHGTYGAYSSLRQEDLVLLEERGLKWYHQSPTEEAPNVFRGFCSECGSSLFTHNRDLGQMAVAAGSLDATTALKTKGHLFVGEKGDFYDITDDLPQFEKKWTS